MKYEYPSLISGTKTNLINSYLKDVSDLENRVEKNKNTIRIGFYNVNMMNFLKDNKKPIMNLLKNNEVDVINFIEYPFNVLVDNVFDKKYNYSVDYNQYLNKFGLKTYSKIKIDEANTGNLDMPLDVEKRGFIHTCIGKYNIISTHLDVWDDTGKKRIKEIKKLISYVKKYKLENVLLGGDFNEVDTSLFEKDFVSYLNQDFKKRMNVEYDMPSNIFKILRTNNFINIFDCLDLEHPKYSCWTGKLVDYCFIYKPTWNGNLIDVNLINNSSSDHGILLVDVM